MATDWQQLGFVPDATPPRSPKAEPWAELGFVPDAPRKAAPVALASSPKTGDGGSALAAQLKQAAFTPAVQAAGGSTVSAEYDRATDAAAQIVSRITGTSVGQLRKDFPAAAFASEIGRSVPEILDFLSSPGGAAAGLLGKIPGAAPAVGAAFTVDMGSQLPEAWEAVRSDPSAENVARLLKNAAFTVLPGIHARSAWTKAGEVGKPKLTVDATPEPTARQARDATTRLKQSAGGVFEDLGFVPDEAPKPMSRAERRAMSAVPETEAREVVEPLVDPKLQRIAADLNLGEYDKLAEADKAVVRKLRDEGARVAERPAAALSEQAREVPTTPGPEGSPTPSPAPAAREVSAPEVKPWSLSAEEQRAVRKAAQAETAPVEAPRAKEPWEMTREEYLAHDRVTGYFDRRTDELADATRTHDHAVHVRRALAAGKPVPSEVLAEYPDLKPEGVKGAETASKPESIEQRGIEALITPGTFGGKEGFDVTAKGSPIKGGKGWAPTIEGARKIAEEYVSREGEAHERAVGSMAESLAGGKVKPASLRAWIRKAEAEISGREEKFGPDPDEVTRLRKENVRFWSESLERYAEQRQAKTAALDRLESSAKARIAKRWKDASTTLSAGPAVAVEQLADYAVVGAAKIAKGAIKFSQFSREMIAEFGEAIRPHLGKIWVRARRLASEQTAAGAGGKGTAAATAPETAAPAGLITSPSYEKTKPNILKHVSPDVATGMEARLKDFEARNTERQTVTFDDIRQQARALDPTLVLHLDAKKMKAGETLDPAVRFAARETLNGLEQEIGARDKQLADRNLPAADRERILAQREQMEQDARRLIDVLIPTRSQDGRNLAYHRMMAEGSFDVVYWLSRAKRAMAIPETVDLPADVDQAIREIARQGEAAERKAVEKVTGAKAGTVPKAEQESGAVPAGPKRNRERATVDKEGKPLPTPEEKIARVKERELEKIRQQMAGETKPARAPSKWELTPEERAKVDADPEVRAKRIELARRMMKLERTGMLDAITAFRRAGLLTGPRTHLRNLGGNTAFQVLEEVSRVPSAVVDSALSVFTGQRSVEGASVKAVAKASYEAATRGLREAKQIMREGATDEQLAQMDLVKQVNTGNRAFDAAVNSVFRTMAAEDRVFKVYAFERSLQEQMSLAKTKTATDAMRVRAWADANYATFNNENLLNDMWVGAKGLARRKGGAAAPAIVFAMDLTVPFARTPSNIVARVIDYTPVGGAIRAGAAVTRAWRAKGWTPENQRAFSQAIGRGVTGAALLTLGYWLAKKKLMTGVSEDEEGNKRDVAEAAGRMYGSILVGGEWHRVDSLSPVGNLLVLGATLHREGITIGNLAKGAISTVGEQPMLKGMSDITEWRRHYKTRGKSLAGSMAGSFVPTILADVAAAADTRRRETRGKELGDSVGRAVAARLPGARNRLPERIDVLGEPLEQRRTSVISPTIGSTAKELSDPLLREMVEIGVGMGKREQGKTEHDLVYRARIAAEGRAIRARLTWLMATEAYRTADQAERKELMSEQISRVRAAETRKTRAAGAR